MQRFVGIGASEGLVYGERLVRTIVEVPESGWNGGSGSGAIGIGTTLSAVDAFRVREAGLIGLVPERGGRSWHLSIVLRDLEIPYVAGLRNLIQALRPGATLVVDGSRGLVVLDPDGETVANLREQEVPGAANSAVAARALARERCLLGESAVP